MKRPARSQRGSLLIGLMVGVSILLIFSAVAVQAWSTTIKRDREEELIFRGKQIAMAIIMYRKDHGAPPTDYQQLLDLGGQGGGRYYLRRDFKDPITGGDWGLVYLSPQGQQIVEGGSTVGEGDDEADDEGDDDFDDEDTDSSGTTGGVSPGGTNPATGTTTPGAAISTAGLPIVGVHSKSDESTIGPNRWHGGAKYSDWIFTINDLASNMTLAPPLGTIGAPGLPTPGQPGGGQPGGSQPGSGTGGNKPGGTLTPK